jgi:hypothetical protein
MLFSLAIIFEAFQWTNLIHVGGGGVVRSKSVSASRNFTSFCKLLQKLENKHLLAFVQKKSAKHICPTTYSGRQNKK